MVGAPVPVPPWRPQDAKVTMKTSTTQARNFRPTIRKIVMALALVSLMGSLSMTPALAKDNGNGRGHADKGWHKGESRGNRDEWRDWRPTYRPVYVEPYVNESSPARSQINA